MFGVNVGNKRFELVFGALCGEVGDLRLEGTDEVGCCVDDVCTEFKDGIWPVFQVRGEFRWVGIEADTEERIIVFPGGIE